MTEYFSHETAIIDAGATIGSGTKVWHFAHVFSGAVIGENCSFGQNTMVANDVTIGSNVKVQNNVAIYSGTKIEDDVFLGPSCVLTNVSNPRSQVVRRGIYEETLMKRGATIGANATIVCGITVGRYSFVAAGAVVTKSIPDYAMVAGVPAKQVGWMSRHGHKLTFEQHKPAICPESKLRYKLSIVDGKKTVVCVDIDEDQSLPNDLSIGKQDYQQFRASRNNNQLKTEN